MSGRRARRTVFPVCDVRKNGGELALIDHPQRAVPDRRAGSDFETIGEAAIRLDNHQGGFMRHGGRQPDGRQPGQAHPHTEHLTRAEMVMARRGEFEKFGISMRSP